MRAIVVVGERQAALGVWHAARSGADRAPDERRVARVREKLAATSAYLLVIRRAGEPVGMALAEPFRERSGLGATRAGWGHLSMVFVHPRHQGQGIGKELVETTIRESPWVSFSVWTRVSNLRAQRLYRTCGFAGTAERWAPRPRSAGSVWDVPSVWRVGCFNQRVAETDGEIAPDTKDWTWVLDTACPECGLESGRLGLADLPELLRRSALRFGDALRDEDAARRRPTPDCWSALEYACHVRDVHLVFAERLRAMVAQDGVEFANWDQDASAVSGRYAEQDPRAVELELVEAAGTVAGLYATVTPEQVQRTGLRSNGSRFTVLTLGQYHLHDVLHHLHDVGVTLE